MTDFNSQFTTTSISAYSHVCANIKPIALISYNLDVKTRISCNFFNPKKRNCDVKMFLKEAPFR